MSGPGRPSRPRGTRAPAGQRGFTLLEVLVALAILSLAVVAAIQLFAGGLRLLKLAGEHQQAALIADEKTREVETPVEGRDTGTEGEFTWERTIRRTEVPAELATAGGTPYDLYAVTVEVKWGGKRSIEVATLRTARPPEPGASAPAPGGARPSARPASIPQ